MIADAYDVPADDDEAEGEPVLSGQPHPAVGVEPHPCCEHCAHGNGYTHDEDCAACGGDLEGRPAMIADAYDIPAEAEGEPVLSGQPHPVEWVRDIPRTCVCEWEWNPAARCYDLFTDKIGCPWHGRDGGGL